MSLPSTISPIRWEHNLLLLLDQRLLPERVEEYTCETLEQAAQAITDLVVRGAPAIGITAAYAVYLGFRQSMADADYNLNAALAYLANARPTAVNLVWAIEQQKAILQQEIGRSEKARNLLQNAQRIHHKDIDDNRKMGDFGEDLIAPGSRVLTHCNAGALATGGYGTALGVIRTAWASGKLEQVFASETRPWLQGARLTAWELAEDRIPVTMIIEGAVSRLFSEKKIDWVIVGADRICANGDVINKIGTANLAALGRQFGVSIMVAAPISTIDSHTSTGTDVDIEERSEQEILGDFDSRQGLVSAWNPVFDVTPAGQVSVIVTEKGVILKPDKEKIDRLIRNN